MGLSSHNFIKFSYVFFKNIILFYPVYLKRLILTNCQSSELTLNFKPNIGHRHLFNVFYFFNLSSFLRLKSSVDITVVDFISTTKRFKIIYSLLSVTLNNRVNVSFYFDDNTNLYSVSSIFNSADWMEREVFDMFGIYFLFHQNFRKILTDYGYLESPLRKNFPLTGFYEVFYSKSLNRIFYSNLIS